jgi:hypothetical protein
MNGAGLNTPLLRQPVPETALSLEETDNVT